MDFDKTSDFEINRRLAELLGLPSGKYLKPSDYDLGEWLDMANNIPAPPDYCNSWADMGQVIERLKIGGHFGKAAPNLYFAVSRDEKYIQSHPNPLRAAAIVAIQVLEAKQ